MTSPSLPPFITRSTRRTYTRNFSSPKRQTPTTKAKHKPSFLNRHGDAICFLWSCFLIAALVYTAFS